MKKKPATIKAKKSPAKHPVPEWMDPEVAAKAQTLGPLERLSLADQLEKAASQLRDLRSKDVERSITITTRITPKMAEALKASTMFTAGHVIAPI